MTLFVFASKQKQGNYTTLAEKMNKALELRQQILNEQIASINTIRKGKRINRIINRSIISKF